LAIRKEFYHRLLLQIFRFLEINHKKIIKYFYFLEGLEMSLIIMLFSQLFGALKIIQDQNIFCLRSNLYFVY